MLAPPGPRWRAPVLRACVATLLVVVVATPASADWTQFHAGPARLGVSTERKITRSTVERLRVWGSRGAGGSAEGIISWAAVGGSRVFVGSDDGRLYAFGLGGAP